MSHSFPGADDITRVELSNGIVVLSRSNFNSPSVVISGYLFAGGINDPLDKLGLADFSAAALLRGSAERSFQEIYNLLESCGASLYFQSGVHTTSFGGQALAEDIDLLLDLLSGGLRQPTFPQEQVERLRAQLLAGLALKAQDTSAMAQMAFEQVVYADHPYSRPEDGYPETIRGITQSDLLGFHRHYYGPHQLVIAVVGAINPDQAVERVACALGNWENPDQPTPPELPPLKPINELTWQHYKIAGKAQADLVMGAPGPIRRSPHFVPANLGNSILGQFGISGRLGELIREKLGLVYYIESSLSSGLGPGPWQISAGVDPQDIEQVVDLVRQEIQRFVSQGVTDEELSNVQSQFIGSMPLSLESNHGVAGALVNLERYQLDLNYYRNYASMIQSVTKEEILQTARHYLDPQRLGIGIAGP